MLAIRHFLKKKGKKIIMDAKQQNNVHSCKTHKFSYKVFFLFLNLACLLKGLFHGHLMAQIGSIIILHA